MLSATSNEKRIFIVDKRNDSTSFSWNRVFNGIGQVVVYDDFDVVLEKSILTPPSIIICNVKISTEQAFTFCKRLKLSVPMLPTFVYFITKDKSPEDWRPVSKLGGVDLIQNNESEDRILNKVIAVIEYQRTLIKALKHTREPNENEFAEDSIYDDERLFLEKAENVVQRNLSNSEFTVKMLADQMGMSHNLVYRRIKNLTGKTAAQFVRYKRLVHAERLIKETNKPIFLIMMRTGFSSGAYFSRCFKQSFGYSPSTYRKNAS